MRNSMHRSTKGKVVQEGSSKLHMERRRNASWISERKTLDPSDRPHQVKVLKENEMAFLQGPYHITNSRDELNNMFFNRSRKSTVDGFLSISIATVAFSLLKMKVAEGEEEDNKLIPDSKEE